MFEASLVNDAARTSRPYTVSVSALLQVGAAAVAVTYPLWYLEALPKVQLRSIYRNAIPLVDPRPVSAAPRVPSVATPRLPFPTPLARPVARTDAALAAPDLGWTGLVSPASSGPGAIDGLPNFDSTPVIRAAQPAVKPPEPKPVAATIRGPVRPGGNVQPPQLLREVKPAYPQLAVATRTQGTVRIEAIISRDGIVRDARVVSGHPLLVASALDAVRQWRYRPTSLNGEPVEVALALEVHFTLAR